MNVLRTIGAVAGDALFAWAVFALAYTVVLQLLMVAFGAGSVRLLRQPRNGVRVERLAQVRSAADPIGVTAVMPAYNESAGIALGVSAMLASDYPDLEVVVVNDGSTDDTLDVLISTFDLLPVECGPHPFPELATNPVRGVYLPSDPTLALRVIDKEPGGNKAFASNVGIASAATPYVLVCDADSLVDPSAISHAMAELTGAHPRLLGVGGTVLPVNDCEVDGDGQVVAVRVPRNTLAACQTVEYLRSFVMGRTAFGAARATPIISGAFGVFTRTDLLAVGGFAPGHLGEDLDLAVRLQRRAAAQKLPTGLAQVPECILWTEVPETLSVLRRQRIRWQRGLHQTMRDHKRCVANPRYGRFGVLGMTYLGLFEYLASLIEATGYVSLVLTVATGRLNLNLAASLIVAAMLAGFATTVRAIWLAERHLDLYRGPGDLRRLLTAAVVEQCGYRQLNLWWRVRAMWGMGRPAAAQWGEMTRIGFRRPAQTIPADPPIPTDPSLPVDEAGGEGLWEAHLAEGDVVAPRRH